MDRKLGNKIFVHWLQMDGKGDEMREERYGDNSRHNIIGNDRQTEGKE